MQTFASAPDFLIPERPSGARRLVSLLASLTCCSALAGFGAWAFRAEAAPLRATRSELILDLTGPALEEAHRPAPGPRAAGGPGPHPPSGAVPEAAPQALPSAPHAAPQPPPGAMGAEEAPSAAPAPAGPALHGGGPAPTLPRFDAAYLNNPAPAYPARSRRAREEGQVILRVLVSPEGHPVQIEVRTGSGFSGLDQAAVATVRQWRFAPARLGDLPVSAWVLVPIEFSLSA